MSSCHQIPSNIKPVENFDLNRYLGKWYEIVRLDHSFERDLSHVTADYSLREDGKIRVVNRGYHVKKLKWKEVEGVAKSAGDSSLGSLKVSFFGPFYGGYHVISLDEDYQYALVCGDSRRYLWILARDPNISPEIIDHLLALARQWGFNLEEMVRVEHHPSIIDRD